jgi:hypothetical protein
MTPLNPQVDCSARQADERFFQDIADPSECLETEILLAMLNPVNSGLRGAEPLGELSLGHISFLPYLIN